MKKLGEEFYNQAGRYSVELIVGDAFVQNPISWKVVDVNLNFPPEAKVAPPESPFRELPEIQHKFRAPEKRPPQTISLAFTAAVLSPILVLLIGVSQVIHILYLIYVVVENWSKSWKLPSRFRIYLRPRIPSDTRTHFGSLRYLLVPAQHDANTHLSWNIECAIPLLFSQNSQYACKQKSL